MERVRRRGNRFDSHRWPPSWGTRCSGDVRCSEVRGSDPTWRRDVARVR
ncbi:hypothetical protein STXM2123_5057 [Streptomyces sp. F-3]|nr:hypothetical protein STXM2123_5057 [Streptomyces sp. F-3]